MNPNFEEILSKHTGEEGIYLTHGQIRGSDALDAMKEVWNAACDACSESALMEFEMDSYSPKVKVSKQSIFKNKIP